MFCALDVNCFYVQIHVQLSLPPAVVFITAYDPDKTEWIDYRVRRAKK